MPLSFRTGKLQVTGYQLLLRRLEQAFIRRTATTDSNHNSVHKGAVFGGGTFAVGILLALAFILSMINKTPQGNVSTIMTTRSGAYWVMFENRLHPVTNLASARLITGKPDLSTTVTDAQIANIARGPLMGIPQAPNQLVPHINEAASWTVCDWRDPSADLSLLTGNGISTVLVSGQNYLSGGTTLTGNNAFLARSADDDKSLWLVWNNHRAQIGEKDFPTLSALGLTDDKLSRAVIVSKGTLNAIDPLPILTVPDIPNRGRVSPAVEGSMIGDVLVSSTTSGERQYYVVAQDGVQRINGVIAQMLVNKGAGQTVVSDPEKFAGYAQVGLIDVSRFPSNAPTITSPTTVCFNWYKGTGDLNSSTKVIIGNSLPITDKARSVATELFPNSGSSVQANTSIMEPGKGYYVRVTGTSPTSNDAEQLFYIDSNGTRYPIAPGNTTSNQGISYDNTVNALGLNVAKPTPIPWSIAQLFSAGSTLDPAAARTQHGQLPVDTNQIPVKDKENK